MEAQVEEARKSVPDATFFEADACKLPFGNASVDALQCARLLIHVPDIGATLEEFFRVMRPGALGVFYEGDMRAGPFLLTSNTTIAKKCTRQSMRCQPQALRTLTPHTTSIAPSLPHLTPPTSRSTAIPCFTGTQRTATPA